MELHRIGRYLVTEVLGRGAAGVVYRAHDPVIDREIALKAVPTDDADPDAVEFRARFLREARAAGRLNHSGIVTVYDVGEDEQHQLLFLTMEFIRGCSLKDVIAAGARLADAEIVDFAIRLAEALDVAHRNGVVHRDLKPANVLISESGEVKLVDFGVARLDTSDLTKDGSSVGTPFYMSPEQIFGRPVDGRSDLYGLGVILYELLSGRRPFTATGIGDLAVQIAEQPPPDLGELRPELAGSIAPVVHRLLAKRPEDRFQTGRELAEAMRGFHADQESDGLVEAVDRVRSRLHGDERGIARARAGVGGPLDTQALGDVSTTLVRAIRRRRPLLLTVAGAVVVVVIASMAYQMWSSGPSRIELDDGGEGARLHEDVGRLQEATDRLEAGDAARARELAEDVLDRRPDSLAADRILTAAVAAAEGPTPTVTASPTARSTGGRRRVAGTAPSATPTPKPTATSTPIPSPAVLEVVFPSPLNAGSLVVEVDYERVDEIRWDFSEEGPPSPDGSVHDVEAEVQIPVGAHQLEVQLHAGRRGQIGMGVFDRDFGSASRWRVVVELADHRSRPTFTLERLEPDR